MKLYLTYNEYEQTIEESFNASDWSGFNESRIDWRPLALYTEKPPHTMFCEELDLDFPVKVGDYLYLVVPRYYDGGTFGRTNGYWHVEGIFKNVEDADQMRLVFTLSPISFPLLIPYLFVWYFDKVRNYYNDDVDDRIGM